MKVFFSLLCAVSLSMSQLIWADPVGEEAAYELVRSRSRTSSLITDGTFNIKVLERTEDTDNGPAFRSQYEYDLKIQFAGDQNGDGELHIPIEFFTPEFMEKLRQDGEAETNWFKIKYLGRGPTSTSDGRNYPDADKILIYDIETQQSDKLPAFVAQAIHMAVKALSHNKNLAKGELEDIKIKGDIVQGLPVLGAARMDISGKYSGFNIKAGFDFVTP